MVVDGLVHSLALLHGLDLLGAAGVAAGVAGTVEVVVVGGSGEVEEATRRDVRQMSD